jgi:hypothetical protein
LKHLNKKKKRIPGSECPTKLKTKKDQNFRHCSSCNINKTQYCVERGGERRSIENDTNRWEWDACRVWRSTSCDGGAQSWDSLMEHLPSSQLHCLPLFSSSSRERAGFFFFWLLILMKQRGGRIGREWFIYSQTWKRCGCGCGCGCGCESVKGR